MIHAMRGHLGVLEQRGQKVKGIEVICHEREFGAEPGEDRYEALLGDVARAISQVAEGSHDALGGPAKGNPQT